ncbi:MAG: hypothetical protein J6M59_06095 [Bacteroidaceae bacterium]|nr:hypothetical protein [Bacteroidaceae bacterium]
MWVKARALPTLRMLLGDIDNIKKNGDKIVFIKDGKKVTIRKNIREKGKKIADKNWVLTAYDLSASDGSSAITTTNQGEAAPATDKSASKDTAKTSDSHEDEKKRTEKDKTDSQGNPINEDGTLKVEQIGSIDELTDEDFNTPTRNVQLPTLSENVANAIGTEGKAVVIKKNIFEKNKKSHKDLTAEQSRQILTQTLYSPNLYGQNQKNKRPYNWILIHLNDSKHSSVILEVNHEKDNVEIVNWHYLKDAQLEQKKRQAVNEGALSSRCPKIAQLAILLTTCLLRAKIANRARKSKQKARKMNARRERQRATL